MDKIDQQLKNLSLMETPSDIHQTVMKKVNHKRMQPILWVCFSLLALSFVLLVRHINMKLVDAEFSDMMQDFFQEFELSVPFIQMILTKTFEVISPALIFSTLLSLFGAIYVAKNIEVFKIRKI